MIQVVVKELRPDFRVFIDLLFGFGRNVDTEGDAYPVYSREWRDLYIKDRMTDQPSIEIYSEESIPYLFEIESESPEMEQLAAVYLYLYCGESITINGFVQSQKDIADIESKYSAEIQRARNSIWHKSNEKNPYPNVA